MHNIWKIFTTDIRRISNNVVAVVIIMGLSILPALYAWFNIFSNWDPYEPAATSQLKVAVASDDAGAEIMGLSLNVGDSVLEALGANTTIGWVFPETTEEALEGVKNSDYYAALIIPETFTQEMLGFIDGEVDHPTIYYYENEKKNGIAPKITGKAKNAVQEQVNATFISTVAEAVMKAGNALSVVNAGGQTNVEESLDTMQAQLQDYVVMLQSFQSIMTSAEMIMETSQNMLPDMDNMLENGRNTMIGMQTMINSSVDAVDVMGDMVSSSMDMVTEALQYLSVFSDGLLEQMGSNNVGSTTDTGLGTAIGLVQGMQANMDVLGSLITGQDAQIQEINQSLKTIEADLKQLQDSKGDVDHDINTLRAQIREQIQICNKQLNNLMSDYNNNVRPSFRATGKSMQQAFLNAAAMMNGTDVNMDEISDILKEYQQTLQEGNVSLQDSLVIAQELLDKVSKIADNIKRITGADSYEDILNNYDSMAEVIMAELDSYKKEFGRKRRTVVENAEEAVFEEKKVEEQEVVFLMDRFGYAKTVDMAVYERNKEAADSENKYIVHCMNTGKLCIFTDTGKMHQVKVLDLPYGKFREKGTPIDNVSNYTSSEEEIVMICDAEQMRFAKLLFATAQGMIKRVDGSEFQVSKRTIAATKLQEEDRLVAVKVVTEYQNVVLQTKNGYFLRFLSADVPEKKKAAVGVRGIKLQKKDELEEVYLFEEGTETKITYGEKTVSLTRLKLAKRDGTGTKSR